MNLRCQPSTASFALSRHPSFPPPLFFRIHPTLPNIFPAFSRYFPLSPNLPPPPTPFVFFLSLHHTTTIRTISSHITLSAPSLALAAPVATPRAGGSPSGSSDAHPSQLSRTHCAACHGGRRQGRYSGCWSRRFRGLVET